MEGREKEIYQSMFYSFFFLEFSLVCFYDSQMHGSAFFLFFFLSSSSSLNADLDPDPDIEFIKKNGKKQGDC